MITVSRYSFSRYRLQKDTIDNKEYSLSHSYNSINFYILKSYKIYQYIFRIRRKYYNIY